MSGIELGYSYELGSGRTRIGVMLRPRWRLGMVMTVWLHVVILVSMVTVVIVLV